MLYCSHRLLCWINSRVRDFLWKLLSFHTKMISTQFLWGIVFLRGDLRKYAKNSNFENFESALYSTSVSMPLSLSNPAKINQDGLISLQYRRSSWSFVLLWPAYFSQTVGDDDSDNLLMPWSWVSKLGLGQFMASLVSMYIHVMNHFIRVHRPTFQNLVVCFVWRITTVPRCTGVVARLYKMRGRQGGSGEEVGADRNSKWQLSINPCINCHFIWKGAQGGGGS